LKKTLNDAVDKRQTKVEENGYMTKTRMEERERERIKALWEQVKKDNRGLTFCGLGNIMLRLHGIKHDKITEATGTLVLAKGDPLQEILEVI
jgi:hypothetical protein